MAERARTLKVGGALLALVVVGLVVGFVLAARDNSPSPDSTASPTATDTKAQVEQAYLRFWDVWTEVNRSLDPAKLDQVMTGNALTAARDLIERQKSKNQPVRIQVEHDYRTVITSADTASIEDNFIDHSVRLDPNTGEPVEKDPNKRVRNSYTMKKVNGTWKVAEIIGFRSSPSP
jgi:hypothetical protein